MAKVSKKAFQEMTQAVAETSAQLKILENATKKLDASSAIKKTKDAIEDLANVAKEVNIEKGFNVKTINKASKEMARFKKELEDIEKVDSFDDQNDKLKKLRENIRGAGDDLKGTQTTGSKAFANL